MGFLLAKLGRGRAIALALLIGAVGLLVVGLVEGSEHLALVLLAMVPLGFGIGISETLSVDAVVSAVPQEKAGAASSISETAYELGAAMGIAVLGSVVTATYRLALPAGSSEAARDSLATAVAALPEGHALETAREAFVVAMQSTTLLAAGVMLAGAAVAFFLIPSVRASREVVASKVS